jgi:hypothetical protein
MCLFAFLKVVAVNYAKRGRNASTIFEKTSNSNSVTNKSTARRISHTKKNIAPSNYTLPEHILAITGLHATFPSIKTSEKSKRPFAV